MDRSTSRAAGRDPVVRLTLRRLHGCAGALFAPAVVFFAVSGLMQVFDLHKAAPGADRQPPAFVRALAQLHKKQTLGGGDLGPRPESRGDPAVHKGSHSDGRSAPAREPLGQQLLKAYAAATSVALALMTLVGLVIGLRNRRDRMLILALLVLGVVAPLGLLLLD